MADIRNPLVARPGLAQFARCGCAWTERSARAMIEVMDDPFSDADDVVADLAECRAEQRAQLLIRSHIEAAEHGWETARPSPGGWTVPYDRAPGRDWAPPEGLLPRPSRLPLWARVWYVAPWLRRSIYFWMWDHGGFDVIPPRSAPGDPTGVREPRRPKPSDHSDAVARDGG